MKVTRNITIDSETWQLAKRKTESISGTINQLLGHWVKTTADIEGAKDMDKVKRELEDKKMEMTKMMDRLKVLEDEAKRRIPVRSIGGGNHATRYNRGE